MSLLIETIKCKDGKLYNLKWHNFRFNQARKEYFGLNTRMNLVNFIKIPSSFKKGLFRCKITYSKTIEKVEFIEHEYREVESLKMVYDDEIDYHLKFADRKRLNELYEKRGYRDDILIVKNGFITDSLTANPIFFDGVQWWTSDTPLLQGTQRELLISQGKLTICKITPDDISKYQKVGLINALQDLDDMPIIEIKNIMK